MQSKQIEFPHLQISGALLLLSNSKLQIGHSIFYFLKFVFDVFDRIFLELEKFCCKIENFILFITMLLDKREKGNFIEFN